MSSGFERIGETELLDTRMFRVVERRFRGPEGEEFDRLVLAHPGAVGVVPITSDGEVVMVRQYRPALERAILEIPAGLRDVAGEDPAETGRRELAEEVGLAAGALEHLITFHTAPGYTDEELSIFCATDLSPTESDAQSVEESHMTIEHVRLENVPALIASGELTDSKTIIGLSLVLLRA